MSIEINTPERRRGRITVIEVLVIVSILAVVASLTGPLVIEIPLRIAFGSIGFLIRTVPEIRPSGEAVVVASVALAIIAVGVHRLGRRCAGGWRFRQTVSVVAVGLLLATAGIGATGVAHQAGWLLNSPEPLVWSGSTARSRVSSKNRLIDIGLAAYKYEADTARSPFHSDGHGPFTRLLPYLERDVGYDFDERWDAPANAAAVGTVVTRLRYAGVHPDAIFPKTDANGRALATYAINSHLLSKGFDEDIPDGTANTLMFGEVVSRLRPWAAPWSYRDPVLGLNADRAGFGSPWVGGCQFTMADGSVRFISENIDIETLERLARPDDGEVVGEF